MGASLTLDEAEAGVDHPVDEPVALLALVLGVEGLEGRKGRVHEPGSAGIDVSNKGGAPECPVVTHPTKLHKRPAPNPKRMNTTVTTARAAAM